MPTPAPDLAALLDSVQEVVCVFDPPSGRVVYANAAFEAVWGRPREAALAADSWLAFFCATVHPDDRARFRHTVEHRLPHGAELEYRVVRPAGEVRWVSTRFRPYLGPPLGWVVATSEDLTARKRHEEQLDAHRRELEGAYARLQEAVVTDPLTGLKNRRGLEAAITRAEAQSYRHASCLSVVAADLDLFKSYNDAHGHPAGDSVLVAVAGLILRSMRPTDTAARVGGEEFVMVLPETDRHGAVASAERLRRAVANARWPHQPVSVSLGVATWRPGDDGSPAELIASADRALYRAKKLGRNRVCHAADMSDTALEVRALGR